MKLFQAAIFLACCVGTQANAAGITVNFDDQFAELTFADTVPLTSQYEPLGITFSGAVLPEPSVGGSILNEGSGFGFSARSGSNFLAFNVHDRIENIHFENAIGYASIWGASAHSGTFTLNAYNAYGTLLDTATANFSSAWTPLSVASDGITRLELVGNNSSYAYDDLYFTSAVPEPSIWAMLGSGLFGLALLARRRQQS